MGEYTFPFDTCESSKKDGIAQPWSALFNAINCIIIVFFLLKTTKTPNFVFIFALLCFELFHTFSHTVHIPGSIQINITHFLAYCVNITMLYLLYCFSHKLPNRYFILLYIVLVCLDIYAIFYMNVVFYLFTQASLFLSILFYYYTYLPTRITNNMYIIALLIAFDIILFLNEKTNCVQMLHLNPDFPYHIFVEIVGILLFYNIVSRFYNL